MVVFISAKIWVKMSTGEGLVAGIGAGFEVLAALEFEVTVWFSDDCETVAFVGGALATVKDAVNCGVAAFETGVAEVAEIAGVAVEVFAVEAVEATAVFATDVCCAALSEF